MYKLINRNGFSVECRTLEELQTIVDSLKAGNGPATTHLGTTYKESTEHVVTRR